jgi:hypothetical protein
MNSLDMRLAPGKSINLKAGELVEVRSRDEVLATLSDQGTLDGLPFMPEMLEFCGQRLRVIKRADKTCDTIGRTGGRRMTAAVHLENVRCNGAAHGGCQAGCLIFWKESWVKRVDAGAAFGAAPRPGAVSSAESILRGARHLNSGDSEADVRYRCQATELVRATAPLRWWDIRQYARDLFSGNITTAQLVRGFAFAGFRKLLEIGIGYRMLVHLYDRVQRYRGKPPLPLRNGVLNETPSAELGLAIGDWVRVKTHDQILATLDTNNKNRGLSFDVEMVAYCGGKYQVKDRVTQIIDERTGRMLRIKKSCIILGDVYCKGEMSKHRLFCPRAIYSYWREIWLERTEPPAGPS